MQIKKNYDILLFFRIGGRKMARYLVSGGAGFIGSHIVEALVNKGEDIVVLDNLSTGKKKNIEPFLDKIKFIEGDICDFDIVKKSIEGVDYVLHQAAISSVPRSLENPLFTNKVNVEGTLNLLVAAKENCVKKFVFASSSSVFGNPQRFPVKESYVPSPLSPYAVSKFSGELYGKVFNELFNLPFVVFRYFNVFGERQEPFSQYSAVIPKFIIDMLKGQRPVIFGDGNQSRDFCYVKNVVNANLLVINSEKATGKVYNIACGKTYTLIKLVDYLNEIIGTNIKPIFAPPRQGDIKLSYASIESAKKDFNYKIEVYFKEGLERTVKFYRSNYGL